MEPSNLEEEGETSRAGKRRVVIVGSQFTGLFAARELRRRFHVTVVDAKDYFEYTPGILRAYVKPEHFSSLAFPLKTVLEQRMGVRFMWGEAKSLDAQKKCVLVKTMHRTDILELPFDFCLVCVGCSYGPFSTMGSSLWTPVVHQEAQKVSEWADFNERFLEGRRRHIVDEFHRLESLSKRGDAEVLVVGAGFIGVEWAAELRFFFPGLKGVTVIDFLHRCLGPLPEKAAAYCAQYMTTAGIKQVYNQKYAPDSEAFWETIGLPCRKADAEYFCVGVKAANYFMPQEVLSDSGPGGSGGWILFNMSLQVVRQAALGGAVWGDGSVFAAGDCVAGYVGEPPNFVLPPVPKLAYCGEEQAALACRNIRLLDASRHGRRGCCFRGGNGSPPLLKETWWPWGAGIFAISLGPRDSCLVVGVSHGSGSGRMVAHRYFAVVQKMIIEKTKVNESRHGVLGRLLWYFVHHTPCNLWGKGPLFA
eukprot:TRINITY_DN7596_c0_g1_i1.p1 TRINITY_DN7596_c0_g1~~TRINITY_DN7596_c0_g1_i1.p1  ORF type:complete len:476 (-),score=82.38 TRINITY_DN7596_c0_g1_i1:80-1507(-)